MNTPTTPPDFMAILDASRLLRTALERELKPSRELSIALTKLDECGMWAASAYAQQNGAAAMKTELDQYDELGEAMRPVGAGMLAGGKKP